MAYPPSIVDQTELIVLETFVTQQVFGGTALVVGMVEVPLVELL